MIEIKATEETRAAYVDNIVSAYRATSPGARRAGDAWYRVAHDLAGLIAGGDTRKGAGILAALSANKRWSDNVRLAHDASAGNVHGHVSDALRKTERIIAGEGPAEVLPHGLKTWHFFTCINDPSDPWAVVIDRHAHDIAVGEVYGDANRGLRSLARYELIADAYRTAARQLGKLPSQVQAATWIAHREKIAGTATRGQLRDPEGGDR